MPIEETLGALSTVLKARQWMLCTAESCTGGLIAARCTDLSGSSQWFDRGLVTYSNAAKNQLLDVPNPLIDTHGAVSEAVVKAMASGVIKHSQAQVAIAVTGIAGPDGGTADKPVGTVWIAWAIEASMNCQRFQFNGDRRAVREQTVEVALTHLLKLLQQD
jgi:nicotinamide-nucleotide amidase